MMCANTHVENVEKYAKRHLAVHIKNQRNSIVRFVHHIISAFTIPSSVDVENAEIHPSNNTIASTIAQKAAAKYVEEMQPKSAFITNAHTINEKKTVRFVAPTCSAVTTCLYSVVPRAKEMGSASIIGSNTSAKNALAAAMHSRNSMPVGKQRRTTRRVSIVLTG